MQVVGASDDRERRRWNSFFILFAWTFGWKRDVGRSRDDPADLVLDRDRPRSENIVGLNPHFRPPWDSSPDFLYGSSRFYSHLWASSRSNLLDVVAKV